MVVDVTAGNVADVKQAGPVPKQARYTTSKFHPNYVIADAGYFSDALRQLIRRQYRPEPVIDPDPSHKRAFVRTRMTPEWKTVYNRRVAIERLNGRLKGRRKLDAVRVRGKLKVKVQATLSIVISKAKALVERTTIRMKRSLCIASTCKECPGL